MEHPSVSCNTVSNIEARKEVLRKFGRCYICLRRGHRARNCPSNMKCSKCGYRHHVSICAELLKDRQKSTSQSGTSLGVNFHPTATQNPNRQNSYTPSSNESTTTMYSGSATCPVLLQTARSYIYKHGCSQYGKIARMIFDNGSQRTYITIAISKALDLPVIGTQTIRVKTFGTSEEILQTVEMVQFCIKLEDGSERSIIAYAVRHICDPLENQFVAQSQRMFPHLSNLWLADYTYGENSLSIDILIGSDQYWSLVTGRTERGEEGPVAVHTKVGWILSGPTKENGTEVQNNNLITTHVLKCSSEVTKSENTLTSELTKFWDLESIGIKSKSVYEEFLEKIIYNGRYYEVSLPWKSTHPLLPDNYDLSRKRLQNF